MPLAVNDIIQITSIGQKEGQTILWTLHYQCTTAPSTGTPAENIQALLSFLFTSPGGPISDAWLSVNNQTTSHDRVRGQKVAPTRGAYVEMLTGYFGDIVDNQVDTANLSWVFVKQSDTPGRRGRGTSHMLLPTWDWVTNGVLDSDGQGARDNLLQVIDDQQAPGAGGVYVPVIYHPGFSPNFTRITHCTQKPEVRTMSRRTVGRGI